MKKLALTLMVLIALAFVFAFTYEMIAKSSLEKMASNALGTDVSISGLDISPVGGTVSLTNITIANPNGFSDEDALTIPYVYSAVDMGTIFTDDVHVKEVRIEGLSALLEVTQSGTNLKAIEQAISKNKTNSTATTTQEETSQKRVVIDRLRVSDSSLRAVIDGAGEIASVDIRAIELNDLGKDQALTTQETIAIVMDVILDNAIKASTNLSLKSGVNKLIEGAGDIGSGIGSSIKGMFE